MARQVGIELMGSREKVCVSLVPHQSRCVFCDAEETEQLLHELAFAHSRMRPKWIAGVPGDILTQAFADAA